MKNVLTGIIAMFIALNINAQFNDTTLVKLNRQIKDGKWEHSLQHTLVYDGNKNIKSILEQKWGGAWDNVTLQSFEYDLTGNVIVELNQRWFEGVWENKDQYKFLWKYDASNKKIGGTRQNWKDGKWVNFQEYTFKYNASLNLQTELVENYDGAVKAKDGTLAKLKDELNTYTYDEKGYVNGRLHQRWNESKKAWENRSRLVYGNDESGNQLSETNEVYNNGTWVGEQNITRAMHANGKFASETFEITDGMGGFVNSKKQFHNYDLKKRHLKTDEKRWDGQVWAPDNVTQCTYKKN